MTVSKPWAAKGVALYPPSFSMVGQNQVLKDFAKTDARATHIFNDGAVLPLLGTVVGVPKQEVERLVYGQLPAPVSGAAEAALTESMADALLAHEVAGRGHAFAELFQVHIDERVLANELTRPRFPP